MPNTTKLQLPKLTSAQAQKHVTHNEALLVLDQVVQISIKGLLVNTPPGSPADSDAYVTGGAPTGAWAGQAGKLATWQDGAWKFYAPKTGWIAYNEANSKIYVVNTSLVWVDMLAAISSLALNDSDFVLRDNVDNTKTAQFELSGIATGTLRTFTLPDTTGTFGLLEGTQTFSGIKTFSSTFTHSGTTGDYGSSTAAATYNLGAGATIAAASKTINIGTSGVATSITNVNIGSAVAGALGTLTVNSPTVTFSSTSTVINATFTNASFLYVGIGGATADATNRLSINSPAALFNHAGNSFNATLNKNAAADNASFTFQVGFSARALMGLLGNDEFSFKVTPDGSTYFTSIRTHRLLHGRASHKSAERRIYQQWQPRVGAAAIDQEGLVATITGTLNLVNPSTSNLFTQSPRTKITSAATAGASAAANGAALFLWRGNAADQGGFYVRMVGGIETFQTTCRGFMGLYSSAAVIGNVNPSTLLNMVGIGFDSAQTTMRLLTNDGTGVATAVDLGANFPTTGGQDLYELILSAEPNGSEIRYRVERLNSGNVAEGVITTDLPANTQFLTPHFWFNNGTTAAAVELAVHAMYAENSSMLGSRGLLI
jgi:Protein of unknown function (DUF2793)